MLYFSALIMKIMKIIPKTEYRIFLLNEDISFSNELFSSFISSSFSAIWPILVCIPVFVTNAIAFPDVMDVPLKSSSSSFFLIELDSPVSVDSSTSRLNISISLQSAGIMLPSSKIIKSPGTICVISISISISSLIILVFGVAIFCNASIVFSAL